MTSLDPDQHKMHLMDHLRELRRRLLLCAIIITIGAVASYSYAGLVFSVLCAPYFVAFPNSPLIGTSPSEAWLLKLKVSVFAGTLLTSPALFYQVWRFISPGLYADERRHALPFIVASTGLFAGGAAFCYWTVLPLTFAFFHDEFLSIGVVPNIKIGEQISMTVVAITGFGVVFELPLITFFLARLGVVNHTLLISWFRHAVVAIFVLAAILTPPDVMTQFLMAVPLIILYGISIGIAYLTAKRLEQSSSSLPVTTGIYEDALPSAPLSDNNQ